MRKRVAPHFVWRAVLVWITLSLPAPCWATDWHFSVWLEQRPIGHHRFRLDGTDAQKRLLSDAQFSVEWLKIPVFRYRHHAEEIWRDGCLQRLDAQTHTNGRVESVYGERVSNGFAVKAATQSTLSTGCVMSFAYWDKRILQQSALLNAQTGRYIPIVVEPMGVSDIAAAGRHERAEHYLLKADDLHIELWYSADGRWLGLAAPTKDGKRMVYRLES